MIFTKQIKKGNFSTLFNYVFTGSKLIMYLKEADLLNKN